METNPIYNIINFPTVVDNDWISNNFLNCRGGRFVAPIADNVTEFMPVIRYELEDQIFVPCPEGLPAFFVCNSIINRGGVRYGVIDCTIRTVRYTTIPTPIEIATTYAITASGDTDHGVTVTAASTGMLFRIIDQNSIEKTITFINA